MTEKVQFHKISDEFLQNLADEIEDKFEDAEVDYLQGILNISINDQQYVINKHEPSLQIWLSSPISGAYRFSYDANKKAWVNNLGVEIKSLLLSEIKTII
jgi:iron donor protein CyaY